MIATFEALEYASHFPKIASQVVVFQRQDRCHLRGILRNAQDTPPVRGSFCCEIKTLSKPWAVSPLSALDRVRFSSIKTMGGRSDG